MMRPAVEVAVNAVVGTDAVKIAEAGQRLEINLMNTSATQKIKLTFGVPTGSTYAATAGLPLFPSAFYWATRSGGSAPTEKAIWAISDAAGATLEGIIRVQG